MFTLKRIIKKIFFYFHSFLNLFKRGEVFIITEKESWIIKTISQKISHYLNKDGKIKISTSLSPLFLKNKIIHFGCIHAFTSFGNLVHPSNKIIISWYHINNRPIEKTHAQEIRAKNITIHTACSSTKKGLIDLGIRAEQIKIVPLGINLKTFYPLPNPSQKATLKERLGLPLDKIIIGSFQKDGNGWEEGLEPKLIKGPDIFCDVVKKLSQKFPLHILLTGPARGYVKNCLKEANNPFTHKYLKKYDNVADFYHALDLYIISSRVEGGPMAILESWATGTPLVSTPVGLIPDISTNEKNILLADIENTNQLSAQAERIIKDKELSQKLTENALQEVKNYTWQKMAENIYQQIYSEEK